MVTGLDLGYQMRLNPKHTNTDTIRRLSSNDIISDVDKLHKTKAFIPLAQTQGTTFKVKGKSVTSEDEKAVALNLAQAKASALSIKGESTSPPISSIKNSARKRRGLIGGTPREMKVKFDDSQKLFVNKASVKQETKLPQIKHNDATNDTIKPSGRHRGSGNVNNVGSWSLSNINSNLLEIDMSGFAPYGEYGYFSAYGVKGHTAYTTSDKLSTNTSSVQSVKHTRVNPTMKDKPHKTKLGLDYDVRTITSGLSRSNLLNELSRSKTLSEFSVDSKSPRRTSAGKSLIHKTVTNKQKMSALPENLNLTRSNTCLVMSADSPRGVLTKRKRGPKEMTPSKTNFGSKESLTSKSEKKTKTANKPTMKTTSTQTKGGGDDSFHSNHLNDDILVAKEPSPRSDLHGQGGILYSSACFDQNMSYANTLNWLKSPAHIEKSLSQNTTPRVVKETIAEDTESNSSGETTEFQIEVSIGRNKSNQIT